MKEQHQIRITGTKMTELRTELKCFGIVNRNNSRWIKHNALKDVKKILKVTVEIRSNTESIGVHTKTKGK